MEGENKKSIKYLMNQPAIVHSYEKLNKFDSPRSHSSPTSILRKFPNSLRHDQKRRTKIKRNDSPINILISEVSAGRNERTTSRKSWSYGDDISDDPDDMLFSNGSATDHENLNSNTLDLKKNSSDTSSGELSSNKPGIGKLQSLVSDEKNFKFAEEMNEESHNGTTQMKNDSMSIEKLSLRKGETIKKPYKKLSVINNTFNECKNSNFETCNNSVNKTSKLNSKTQFSIHKSTPNLFRSSISHSERMTDRLSDESDSSNDRPKARPDTKPNGRTMPLRESDSLPHLDQRHRIINSILPRINRTISERPESLLFAKKSNLAKACIKSESHINSQNLYNNGVRQKEPYFSLMNILDFDRKSDVNRSNDENEGFTLIDNHRNAIVRSPKDRKDAKNRWSNKKTVDIMPTLRNLVGKRKKDEGSVDDIAPTGASAPLMTSSLLRTDSFSSLNIPQIRYFDVNDENLSVKKCETVYALTSLIQSESPFCLAPIQPVNRLRVPPNGFSGSTFRMCSRCSSLLSMASSSRYSINTTGSGFVNCSSQTAEKLSEPNLLCKLCLMEVPISFSLKINSCGCIFCKDCMKLYVEFEIQEGAYDISCPDAQCSKQGIVSTDEVGTLVLPRMMERYRRFRLNHEVDMDRNRTWCPRAGCETICDICPREKCAPMCVHCPTCDSDFCSNCKNNWHKGLTCEENSKKLVKEGLADFMESGIPFDSESIKCCPMCNVPIEKDEGCAQMMCKRCKHVFCWYCLASLDDDFLLRHYDKGPCKNKLGHTRASVIWHRIQVIGIFAGLGLLLLVASPLLLLAAPCIVCCKCRVCSCNKLDPEDDLPEDSGT